MKRFAFFSLTVLALSLLACGGSKQKKVIVMATGDLKVEGSTISIDPSMSYKEQELIFTDDKVSLVVKSTDGTNKTLEITEPGLYVLNLQKDTLVGGIVNYGSAGVPGSIKSEEMDKMIDSTVQLMAGKNVSDEKKTYFIVPYNIKKIGTEVTAIVRSSFRGIPGVVEAGSDGKVPEVYKFFTVKQKRETLADLQAEREKLQNLSK
ncbi:MAG: hypothetical protein SFU21_06315 [Flavihumibacter sp.]|nr:hypothetical protein [Flavihumibacter sp.]